MSTVQIPESVVIPDPTIAVSAKTVKRMEDCRRRVAETTITLDRAKREHTEAKSAHESALTNLSTVVVDMLDEINGVSKYPLFQQAEAVEQAKGDPIAQTRLQRMIDHGITHLNVLVVAGYTAEQGAELDRYLGALDMRKQAEADGNSVLPELVELPAFLVPQTADLTGIEVADLLNRLQTQGIESEPEKLEGLAVEQVAELRAWLETCECTTAEKGDALVAADLPPAPPAWFTIADEPNPDSEDDVDPFRRSIADVPDGHCYVCGAADGIETTEQNALNGLPVGVRACDDCRQGVKDRRIGVTLREDGDINVVAAAEALASEPDVIDEEQPKELATEYDEKEMKRRAQKGRKKKGGR